MRTSLAQRIGDEANKKEDVLRALFFLGFEAARNDQADAMEAGEAWDRFREEAMAVNDGKRPISYKQWAELVECMDAGDLL